MKRSKKYIDAVMAGVRIQSVDQMFSGDTNITISTGEVSIEVEIVTTRLTSLSYARIAITPSIPKETFGSTDILRLLQIVNDLKAKELVDYVVRYFRRADRERRRIQKKFRSSDSEMED